MKSAIDGCFGGGGVGVVKIGEDRLCRTLWREADATCFRGCLASAETVRIVVDALRRYEPRFVVVDPVRWLACGSFL